METLKDVLGKLSTASSKYRSAPFWAWNDSLDKDSLIQQIGLMKEQGMGGFFIHSREGLETEYLSREWMDRTAEVVDEAEQSGMEVWIYDEDTWPSGSAGGAVSAADPKQYSARALTIEVISSSDMKALTSQLNRLNDDPEIIAIYEISSDPENSKISSFGYLQKDSPLPDYDTVEDLLICRVEISGKSEWYNGSAPSDNLNPEAVRVFLQKTHHAYARRFSDKFASVIKGFFTDEPNICDFFASYTCGRPWLPWSALLPVLFEEKRGYSLFECIPLLFFNGPGSEKVRYDYWLSLTELFVSSYTRQLYDWCEENELMLTGHMLYENDFGYGIRCNGAVMPHYRYMHAPGIDLLGDQRDEYLTVKQCTSVANQFKREMVVSEMYGCTGWDFSFAGQKRLGDWQYIMGVTRRCQHLALSSITGCRKRDYPPAFNYQSTSWEYSHILEEYFHRLGVCTSSGEISRNILMIHPIGTFWMKSGSSVNEDLSQVYMNMGWLDEHMRELNRNGDSYNKLTEQLLRRQFDFDFGDELIMRDSASVVDGQIQVGLHRYSYIVVPSIETLMESTLNLLRDFLNKGGHIFWLTPFPTMIDALPSGELDLLYDHANIHKAENVADLLSLLSAMVKRPLRICNAFGREQDEFLSMTRKTASGWIVTISNSSNHGQDDIILNFSTLGRLTELDLFSGKQNQKTVELVDSSGMCTKSSFDAEETKVFLIDQTDVPETIEKLPVDYRHPHDTVDLLYSFPPVSTVKLTSDNGLTLDTCCFRISDESWSEEEPVWLAQKKIRERFGMQAIHYNGGPQRYLWIHNDKGFSLSLRFSFIVDKLPEENVFVVIEKSKDMHVKCNDMSCTQTDEWFIDRDFHKHRISSLRTGINTLEIDLQYTAATELEDIYITGAFGVSPERHITTLPPHLRRGDWTLQGLKHYSGSCIYSFTVPGISTQKKNKSLFLKLGAFRGALAIIRIGDCEAIYTLTENSFPVDRLINQNSETLVEIEIVGNLRNLLGPLHQSAKVCSRISWEDFHPTGEAYTAHYMTEPMGLFGEVTLLYK